MSVFTAHGSLRPPCGPPRTAPGSSACLCGIATRGRMQNQTGGQGERRLSIVNTTIGGLAMCTMQQPLRTIP